MDSRNALPRLLLVVLALLAATLACNIKRKSDIAATGTAVVTGPTVSIVAPAADNANFTQGQNVTVRATAFGSPQAPVELVELKVKGVRVDSQFIENPSAQAEVLLTYRTQETGAVTLEVVAYTSSASGQRLAGPPAQRTINVLGPLSPGADGSAPGAGTPQTLLPPTNTPYDPTCRVVVEAGGLRFRAGPGTEYDQLTNPSNFSAGDVLRVTGYSDRDYRWWQVVSGLRQGWVAGPYVSIVEGANCSNILPVLAPPTPTPASSATPTPSNTPPPSQTPQPTAPGLPDLQVSVLDGPSEIQLAANGTAQATYTVAILNAGGRATGQFQLSVAPPEGQEQRYDVPGLSPGQEFAVPSAGVSVSFTQPGSVLLIAHVDSADVVQESNEQNNVRYLQIEVLAPPDQGGGDGGEPPDSGVCRAQTQDALNLRAGPATAYDVLLTINAGEEAEILSYMEQTDGLWYEVSYGGTTGWISAQYTDQLGDCTAIPLGVIPPLPEPEPDALQPITVANAGQIDEVRTQQGHGSQVAALDFSPDNRLLASGSWDAQAIIWDVASGAQQQVFTHGDRVVAVAFSPDGSRLATATQGGLITLWDVASGESVSTLEHDAEVYTLAFSPDGLRLVSGGRNPGGGELAGQAAIWNLSDGTRIAEANTFAPVSGVAFIDNGATLVVSSLDPDNCDPGNGIEFYDAASGALAKQLDGHSGRVAVLALNELRTLIAGSGRIDPCAGNGVAWVWNAAGTFQVALEHSDAVDISGLALSNSNLLVSAGADGVIRLWDINSQSLLKALNAHNPGATTLALSPDGTLLASGGADSRVRLWGMR